MTDPEGNLTGQAQGPVAEWAARELAEAEKSPEYWREMARLYRDDCSDLQARLSQALEENERLRELLTMQESPPLPNGIVLIQHYCLTYPVKLHEKGQPCPICALTPAADAAEGGQG